MELNDTAHGRVAMAFAQAIVGGDYTRAHQMLSKQLAERSSPSDLAAAYERMVAYGVGLAVAVRVMGTLRDWADRRDGDIGWAYVGIDGRGFSEAVAVVVASQDAKPVIRELEWGRP